MESQCGSPSHGQRGKPAGRTRDTGCHRKIVVADNAGPIGNARNRAQPVEMSDSSLRRRPHKLHTVNSNRILLQAAAVVPGDRRRCMRVRQGHTD